MRILLVEDDRRLAETLSKRFRAEGCAVDVASDGLIGEEWALTNDNDVIILDILLPKQDGWTTCANIRKAGVLTPVLMLTALEDVDHRIRGLDTGADDYLPKPFHFRELMARVRALTRRRTEVRSAKIEKFGLILDLNTHSAQRDDKDITLTSKEFALLELFVMNAGRILSREEISEHLWDMNFEPKSNVIEAFIKYLRQKIDKGFDHPLIHTVRGAGYIFSDREP